MATENDTGETGQNGNGNDNVSWEDKQLADWMTNDGTVSRTPTEGDDEGGEKQQQGSKETARAADGDGKGKDKQQQADKSGQGDAGDREIQSRAAPPRKFGSFYADARGDIYTAGGTLVAKQGYGRSIFHKLYPYIERNEQELTTLRSRVEAYENANKLAKDAGLSLEEQGAALQLMLQWRKSPAETIKSLLRIAGERGIDTSSIVQGGGGADASALRAMVNEALQEHLKPFQGIVADRTAQAEELELQDRARTEYTDFMQRFPDAQLHEAAIARVMADHQMDATGAYFACKTFALENGLDWTKRLEPQIEARANGNGRRQTSGGGNNRRLPAMNGRTHSEDVNVDVTSRGRDASVDESWDSIARRTLKQHRVGRYADEE